MNNKILYGVGGIVVGMIVIVLLSITGQTGSMMWGRNNLNGTASNRNIGMVNRIDEHFIEQMIPHHDGAVAMAELALVKSTRPEIKNLAGEIIEAQNKEIKEMRVWYKDWFGKDVGSQNIFPTMGGGMMSQGGMHMGGGEDVKVLENAPDFDKAFIESMIPHHQLAIMMAQMLKSGTNRPEMLNLANNIIDSQSKEIKEMQGWYAEWYK